MWKLLIIVQVSSHVSVTDTSVGTFGDLYMYNTQALCEQAGDIAIASAPEGGWSNGKSYMCIPSKGDLK